MKQNWYQKHPFRQGIFKPRNPNKCENKGEIEFRSGLEFKYMTLFDKNIKILSWGSENVILPYIHPIRGMARYFVDFHVKLDMGQGRTKDYLIEVKPEKQKKEVIGESRKKGKKESQKSYIYRVQQRVVNTRKWEAAQKYCIKKGWEFKVLTEKDLKKF